MLWQGVHPKWITHFPEGRHILDDGVTTDESFWAAKDAVQEDEAEGITLLTPEEQLDLRLREMGY